VKKALCVCFGNTCRSPMMQVLLQQQLGQQVRVESAGIREGCAGQSANEHSVLCMSERGIDLTGHQSRWVGDLDLSEYSHIVCVGEPEAQVVCGLLPQGSKTVVLIANESRGGVPNPYEKGLDAYRECLATLDEVLPPIAKLIK
jgi:protein-tyrosine-phosphatase